ncbi:MAG: transposase [Deltaproteobacteria bacterium]|nr:transposase [Deltaproteobacteria bacterium]
MPFLGKNFFRSIVINDDLPFGKDAAYDLLKGSRSNWRRFLLTLGARLYRFFNRLTSDERESVLIIDDSTYDRSRSKKVELPSRVWDHTTGRFVRGFRMLTLCWSDGVSCLPLDFTLLSSNNSTKRFREATKVVDKRCCAYKRREEATIKSTAHLGEMAKRVLSAGIDASYVLMDSWFGMPAIIVSVSQHLPIICVVKKTPKILYGYGDRRCDLMTLYRCLKKRRGRAKILASIIVTLKDKHKAKVVFVRDRRKKDWLALLSTDIHLPDEDIVRIYGKRWDIEVFFKMAKQHLKLAKEIQCRDFDALIAHTTIVFMRYMFLAYRCRLETDHRTFGDLFYACCDELGDISFVEALYRILTLTADRLREMGAFCERTAQAFFDTLLETALSYVNLSKNKFIINEI